jgi:hypothetical protein
MLPQREELFARHAHLFPDRAGALDQMFQVERIVPAGTGVWVVNIVVRRTSATASSQGIPFTVSCRTRSSIMNAA